MTSVPSFTPKKANGRTVLPVLGEDMGANAPCVPGFDEIEAELKAFEQGEKQKMGIVDEVLDHWFDANPQAFSKEQRGDTTLLIGGLTQAQDYLISGALKGLGYVVEPMEVPDNEALRYGKEFGNRGQCNPTYFTVGNLVKTLLSIKAEQGLTEEKIVKKYVFVTAGACGPCRFGTYTTEYRKALRDAGFDGFRVMFFQQQGGLKQATGDARGLELNPKFFISVLKAIMAGDVLNAMGYRIRPYEVNPGETNEVLAKCKKMLHTALNKRKSILWWALYKCKRLLKEVKVDRAQPKPKVSIIGEFWAMTTEGEGNYWLQTFLEQEGAECDIQLVSAWLLYNVWQVKWDTKNRMSMRKDDDAKGGLKGKNPVKRLAMLTIADKVLRVVFHTYAKAIGLENYVLPDMDEIATISHQYYDNHLRGGEGHMEVGKLIKTVKKKKAHMVISVKPFGCMPSSGVSDGIQSLITAKYPEAIFTAIETTGDGAVNVQSRVQMDLFKARLAAKKEYAALLEEKGLNKDKARHKLRKIGALDYPAHKVGIAGTGATFVDKLA